MAIGKKSISSSFGVKEQGRLFISESFLLYRCQCGVFITYRCNTSPKEHILVTHLLYKSPSDVLSFTQLYSQPGDVRQVSFIRSFMKTTQDPQASCL